MAENKGFIFGFGSIMIKETSGALAGAAHITGALTAEIMQQAVKKMGGAASYPVDMRLARSEGNLTLTLNERRPWVDEIINEGVSSTAASASSLAIGTIENVTGTTLAAKLTVAKKSGVADANVAIGTYYAQQLSATSLKITYAGPRGGGEFLTGTMAATTAVDIGSTGLTIEASAVTFAAGAVVTWEVTPAHGGVTTVTVPQVRKGKTYELIAWGAAPSQQGNVERVRFPLVMFQGANWVFTDNEYSSSGIEITGGILAPTDGGEIMERKSYQPV